MHGKSYDLEGVSRREYLRAMCAGSLGVVGLSGLVEGAHGENPDGVPLVTKYDLSGQPAEVRFVSKERKRRLETLENIGSSQLGQQSGIKGISLERVGSSTATPRIVVEMDRISSSRRSNLPAEANNVPIKYKEVGESEIKLESDCRAGETFDTLEGNIAVGGATLDGTQIDYSRGTLSFVANDSSSGDEVAVTAYHVMEEHQDNMHQPPNPTLDGSRIVGSHMRHSGVSSNGYDLAVYSVNSGENINIAGTKEGSQADISGTYSYAGLEDTLSRGYEPEVSLAGKETCYETTNVKDVKQNAHLKHEVQYYEAGIGGDSGSPLVDEFGYLVGTHSGDFNNGVTSGSFGPVANEALNSLNIEF